MELTEKTVLSFGKYKGKSIRWILDNDSSYLKWMQDNIEGVFFNPSVSTELAFMIENDEDEFGYTDGLSYFDVLN